MGLHLAGTSLTGWLVGSAIRSVAPERNAPWIIGRASGLTCLALLTAVSISGLLLAHPWRARRRRPHRSSHLRLHVSLAAFTLALFVVHVVVLATDEWARVGWWGAFLPMASDYRPLPVTFGVLAGYSGLVSGLTATFAGRWTARAWWPLHRFATAALVLSWLHGLTAGSDSVALLPCYLGSGVLVLLVGASRYVAVSPSDRVRSLIEASRVEGREEL